MIEEIEKFYCVCGCGEEVKFGKKYIYKHNRRGQKLSEETRAKMSLVHTGHFVSEETKAKISLALSGENNPNFGKDYSGKNGPNFGKKHSEETRRKMSIAKSGENNPNFGKDLSGVNGPFFGRRHSEESIRKMSIAKSGENCNWWQGGITGQFYGVGDDEELRDKIRARDNYICQECGVVWNGVEKKFHPHHIDYDKNNHVPWNRITLCPSCHPKTNTNREYWIERLYSKRFSSCLNKIIGK